MLHAAPGAGTAPEENNDEIRKRRAAPVSGQSALLYVAGNELCKLQRGVGQTGHQIDGTTGIRRAGDETAYHDCKIKMIRCNG